MSCAERCPACCVRCCPSACAELHLENLDLDETTTYGSLVWVEAFGRSKRLSFQGFLRLRIFNAAFMCGVLIASLTLEETQFELIEYWPIYLTHWTLLVQVTYVVLAALATYQLRPERPDAALPINILKAVWVLQGICVPATLLVFIMYWCLVFPFSTKVYAISFLTHGVNFAIQLLDLVMNQQPYLLMHGLYFALYAALFLLWSVIHYATSIGNGDAEKYIYKALDWGSPGAAATVVAFILLGCFPLLNCLCWWFVHKVHGPVEDRFSASVASERAPTDSVAPAPTSESP